MPQSYQNLPEYDIKAGQRSFSGEREALFVRAYLNLYGRNVRVRV